MYTDIQFSHEILKFPSCFPVCFHVVNIVSRQHFSEQATFHKYSWLSNSGLTERFIYDIYSVKMTYFAKCP